MTNSHLSKRLTALITMLIVACTIAGCQQYGEVSPKCYEFAKALYSICNRKDVARLRIVDKAIKDAVTAKQLPADEAAELQKIIQQASEGQWSTAMQDCRTLMSEQNVAT